MPVIDAATRTGERASPVAAALLLPLVDRVPVMAAPCRMHASIDRITAALADWTREVGLETPVPARFDRMAGRAFAGFGTDSTLLFAKWLTWLFHFDDEWDEKPAGRATGIVEATFSRLVRHTAETAVHETQTVRAALTLTATRPRPAAPVMTWVPSPLPVRTPRPEGVSPVEVAFRDLWGVTAPRMSRRWRERFADGLAAQGTACRTEAENRCAGRVPSVAEYPVLRRGTVGPYLFDLVEPCLGVEVPAELRESPTWRTLVDACNDVTAWCNDVASHHKERANGDVHNYVTVAAHAFGLSDAEAVAWVNDRIAERAEDLRAAARRLPGLFDAFGLTPVEARNASKVACAFLTAPRAQLEWLLESRRYDVTA
ncbi:terpene synthase family protein [Streptosporangium saharense]|uniref:terpene synthase family protein n=1 Tax=Streptosporangium saharense TaxID=1706840 RepID=UPI00331B757F